MESPDGVLCESVSPNGNVDAFVEQYEDCCYFYLRGAPEIEFGIRSCWVRNLRAAPESLDVARMREGTAPMLPANRCGHPAGAAPLGPEDLEIVWLEEGDAAALLERGEILAIIPSWAGSKGFEGYARDCIQKDPLCWPLGTPENNVLFSRVYDAKDWWASWETGEPWDGIQAGGVAALEQALGKHTNYYAIDGGDWPPKAMLRFECPGGVALATCGVAIRPQPSVESAVADPTPLRRIELGLAVDDSSFEEAGRELMVYLSGQSNLPWHHYTWLGEGHTIPCDAFARSRSNSRFTAVLLAHEPPGAPSIRLPHLRGDPVSLLWAVPISESERTFAMGSGSAALLDRLAKAGHGWLHKMRAEVVP